MEYSTGKNKSVLRGERSAGDFRIVRNNEVCWFGLVSERGFGLFVNFVIFDLTEVKG
jgi:hypothetical protein